MKYQPDQAIDILQRTPDVLTTLLQGLPDDWTHSNEGGESWSPFDVIGHLIHGEETDWIPRAEIILHAEDKYFEPYDRFAQFEKSKGKTLHELLDDFRAKRQANISKLKAMNISGDQWELKGIHPEFGEVTLRQLLSTWVVHDLSHIAQISRVMGKQYREEVGPWKQYISMLGGRE